MAMKHLKRYFLHLIHFLFVWILFFSPKLWGQTDGYIIQQVAHDKGAVPILNVDYKGAYIPPTNEFLDGDNVKGQPIDFSNSLHLKLGFRFHPDSYLGKHYPETFQGFGVSVSDYKEPEYLGVPISVYVFQSSPIHRFTSSFALFYEWNFGASFGWKPYHPESNDKNHVIGSKSNFYLNMSAYGDWKIRNKIHLQLGLNLTHYSNGNTAFPNTGLNEVGLRAGVRYDFKAVPDELHSLGERSSFRKGLSYDVLLYGAMRRKGIFVQKDVGIPLPQHFAVAGFNFAPMYNLSRYWKVGASLDYVYDESIGVRILDEITTYENPHFLHYSNPPYYERMSVGVSARGEFVMPFFSINVGMGVNVYHRNSDARGFYQVLGLKTTLTRNMYLFTGYSLHNFSEPNHLMFGLGYRFKDIPRW